MGFPPHSLSATKLAALQAAERNGAPFLAYKDGGGELQLRALGDLERLTVGRSEHNRIASAGTPRSRARTPSSSCVGGDWTLVDDGLSRNGTFVNGERLARAPPPRGRRHDAHRPDAGPVPRPGHGLGDHRRRRTRPGWCASARPSCGCWSPSAARSPARTAPDPGHQSPDRRGASPLPERRQDPHPRPVRQARHRRAPPVLQAHRAGPARAGPRPRRPARPRA